MFANVGETNGSPLEFIRQIFISVQNLSDFFQIFFPNLNPHAQFSAEKTDVGIDGHFFLVLSALCDLQKYQNMFQSFRAFSFQ